MRMVNRKTMMTEEKFDAIKRTVNLTEGKKLEQVAKLFNVHYSTACRVKKFNNFDEYQAYIREAAASSNARRDAKVAEARALNAEAEQVETPEAPASIVVDTETLSQAATKQDLAEMEARLTTHITKQIGGLRIYLAGPNKIDLVSKLAEAVQSTEA